MFQGTLPAKAMTVVANIVMGWNVPKIYVGCSGNFTIERCIAGFYEGKIYSNDVTIYSSVIGRYLSGQQLGVRVKEDYDGECQYFREYVKDDVSTVATMMLAADVLKYEGKSLAYFKRMLKAYEKQWPELHWNQCEKLEALTVGIEQFYCEDVMDMLDRISEDSGFISFPPFFKGGYEKMWQDLERVFEFEKPQYEEFDPNVHLQAFVEKVLRIRNFVICTERLVPELEEYYCGTVETGKGKFVYIYSRTDRKVFIKNRQKNSLLKVPRISEEDRIEEVQLCEISHDQFEELRAVYLSKGIVVARESKAYGLFTKGKLFGVFGLSSSMMLTNFENMIEGPSVYLMTDFAVSPTCEKHLSKLVLMCVLSKEVQLLAEKLMGKRVRSVCTNAFSRNPVSMKYRGLFDVLNRKEIEKDEAGNVIKYNITYGARYGQWTLQEAYEKWKSK